MAGNAYLVVMDRGGLFGVYFSEHTASEVAESIQGAVIALPITEDHRPMDDRNMSS